MDRVLIEVDRGLAQLAQVLSEGNQDPLNIGTGGLAFIAHGIPIGPMSMSLKSAIRAAFQHPAPASAANMASPSGALQITPWCRALLTPSGR